MGRGSTAQLYNEVPALAIADDDGAALRHLVMTLVEHNAQQRSTMVVTRDGFPDAAALRWKELRRKERLRIYRERAKDKGPLTPSLLLMGTIDGTLDDVMLGIVAATDADMKLKSAAVQDGLVDCKVLHKLVRPTLEDPFHHVAVTWRLFDTRDYVSLDATGCFRSSDRERIGYSLLHSVAFPQLPTFARYGITRGNMSVCALYRQNTPATVEVYVRGFFEFGRTSPSADAAALQAIAMQWSSYSRSVRCADMKKLVWRVRQTGDTAFSLGTTPPSSTPGLCSLCRRSFGYLGTSRATCRSCLRTVCTRCSATRQLFVAASDGRSALEKRRAFCASCICSITNVDALTVARDELVGARLNASPDSDKCSQSTQSRQVALARGWPV